MKFVVRSMVVAGWWAQQSGVVNEKMEREDGIYKKDLPPVLHAHADLSGFHSQIINRASIYDSSTTFF